eukprot:1158165-Pelagomonas_calceolata.AAC.4
MARLAEERSCAQLALSGQGLCAPNCAPVTLKSMCEAHRVSDEAHGGKHRDAFAVERQLQSFV